MSKPEPTLTTTSVPSTGRTVVIMCKSERKPTEHKFVRPDTERGTTRLVFACRVCEEERIYGVNGG